MNIVPLISGKEKDDGKRDRVHSTRTKITKKNVRNPNNGNAMKKKRRKFSRKAKAAIYIGHIPHGFYEDEMSAYFNQFGKVHSAMVARSKKTGRSKGYGFVEFEDEEVAKIAAETMNNYLMFNKVLKCRYIPPEERKRRISVRTMYPVLPKVKNRIISNKNKRNAFEKLDQDSYQKKAQKKINEFKKFFEERGIPFSFNVNFVNVGDDKSKKSTDAESGSLPSCNSESEDDTDDQYGVLEIDESDNDIQFKTPPQVKKVIKRSSSSGTASSITCNKVQKQEEKNNQKSKRNPVLETEIKTSQKKIPKGICSKLEKKSKSAEKPLLKSFKSNKTESKRVILQRCASLTTVSEEKRKKARR